MRFPVWVFLAGLTVGCCFAQDDAQPQASPVKTCGLPGEASGVRVGPTIIKGMPYRAKRVYRCEETLADGTVVKNEKSFLEWRDSLGRMRTQALDPVFGGSDIYRVEVSDPVNHVSWQWDEGQDSSYQTMETKYKFRREYVQWPTDFDYATPVQPEGPTWKVVRLQSKWVNGVYAKGELILNIYKPGESGNNTTQLAGATSESWLSIDLGEIVKSVNTSPDGSKDMEDLYVLDRLEPDGSLFEPPAGNEILETRPVGDAVNERTTQEPSHPAEQPGVKAPAGTAIVTISPTGSSVTTAHIAQH